jgi:hypothetical protein
MRNRTVSKPKSGAVQRYHDALIDLRANPGKYRQQEWCRKNNVGHSLPRAMVRLGYASVINGRLHLLRERITDAMIAELVAKKRSFDNLRHPKHEATKPMPLPLFEESKSANDSPVIEPPVQPLPQVGLIRRFIRWIW